MFKIDHNVVGQGTMTKLSNASFLDKVLQPSKQSITGVDFYKDVITSEQKRRNRTQVRRGVRNGAVLLLSNYKPKDFGNA